MIRVMLVDGDKESRKKIKDYIHHKRADFEVVKEADDGLQALEVIENQDINLVISELRLQNLSGYHLFKKIKYDYPDVLFVLYSYFEEYEYLKHAAAEGVLDYFYMPLKLNELERCLIKAKQAFGAIENKNREESKVKFQFDDMQAVFEDRFLINLVHGRMESEDEIDKSFKHFGISLAPGYTVMVLKVDHYNKLNLVFEGMEKELFIFKLLKKVQAILSKQGNGIAFINNYDEITVILGRDMNIEATMKLAEDMRMMAKSETITTVTIGIGKMYPKAADIYISYKQASAALRHSCHVGNNTSIHISFVEPGNQVGYRYPRRKEEILVYETVIGNRVNALRLAEEIHQTVSELETMPEKLLSKIILNIVIAINRYASEQGINLENLYASQVSVKDIGNLDTADKAFEYLKSVLNLICDFIEQQKKLEGDKKYRFAKAYIESHYNMDGILTELPVAAKMPYEYLDRQFASNMNMSIHEYILQIRMEKAKLLLVDTQYADSEIARMVGIGDVKYFQYLFIQREGINTLDYRNLNNPKHTYGNINLNRPFGK